MIVGTNNEAKVQGVLPSSSPGSVCKPSPTDDHSWVHPSLVLSAVSAAKTKAWGSVCINNQSRLMRAYLMHAADHDDEVLKSDYWCGNGALDWTDRSLNREWAMLVDWHSRVGPYVGNTPQIFKCPADRYFSSAQRAWGVRARVRSVAMNEYSGRHYQSSPEPRRWRGWRKTSDLVTLAPTDAFVLLDEHPDSINDAMFFATGWVPKSFAGPFRWYDIPATYHAGGVNFAFLDGHVELNKWRGRLTTREWMKVQYRDRHEDAFLCRDANDANDLEWVMTRMADLE